MRRDDIKKFASLSCDNAQYSYWPQLTLTQCCQTEMWWSNLDWKKNLASNNHQPIDLNLMWNKSTCLNAFITLSKIPIMMQTQIRATNMRWGGMTFQSLQPCLVPMPNTVIGHSWLSHYVAKQKCDDQIWTGRKILQEITIQQLTWTWCKISWPASMHQ